MSTIWDDSSSNPRATVACPRCGGIGSNEGFSCGPDHCNWRAIQCTTCAGTGQVVPLVVERIRVGEIIRQDRLKQDRSGREEAKRLDVDMIAFNYLETGRGEILGQFTEFRKDGWPFCPRCGNEELYSYAGMAYSGQGPRPTLAEDFFSGFGCYYCGWKTTYVNWRIAEKHPVEGKK